MENRLTFKYNWEDSGAVRGDELKATWSTFSIVFHDEIITEIVDQKSSSSKEHLYIPLYPLAEWIVINWWFLMYEPFTPEKYDRQEYEKRHNMAYAREGYALPFLAFQPIGDKIILSWKESRLPHHKVKFINSGEATISLSSLYECLYDFVSSIIERLELKHISGTLLQREWEVIHQLDGEQKLFCQIAASTSVDPFGIDPTEANDIITTYNELPSQIAHDFFPSSHPRSIREEAKLTIDAIKKIQENEADIRQLTKIRREILSGGSPNSLPWKEGYEAARELRNILSLNGNVLKDFSDIGKAFKITEGALEKTIIPFENKLPITISAISGLNKFKSPNLILGDMKNDSRKIKFAYCRALYEYFFSGQNDVYLVTRTYSETQKRNRAFAAEFLVPAEKLRQKIIYTSINDEFIDEMADEFNVDSRVIRHQIENHQIAEIVGGEF